MLKERLPISQGLQYVTEQLELMSSAGRRRLLHQPMLTDAGALNEEYDNTAQAIALLADDRCRKPVIDLRHCLMQLHDIQNTLTSLATHQVLTEVDLFEIKKFAHLALTAAKAASEIGDPFNGILGLPDLHEPFGILDPDGTQVPHFYIYDSYHPDLPGLRRAMKAAQDRPEELAALMARHEQLQREVITRLCDLLQPHAAVMDKALQRLAYLDVLLAKAELSTRWHLCRPTLAGPDEGTAYKGLYNPRLKARNEELGLRYQPVDIELRSGLTLITGANMAGKTVLLKTVATAQLMAQYGFYVPADEARVVPVDDVETSIGDAQDEMNGLSSFASEIGQISHILQRSRSERLLILIDEPARTTNPIEGRAIVQALCRLLATGNGMALITTHYSQLHVDCRRLRVKGFVEDMDNIPITPQSINRFIDYSLQPDDGDHVPHEALRIATLLNADKALLEEARLACENTTPQP